ncbi:MAG: hypothetical protein ABI650_08175 [Dokdonella sp.]
MNLMASKAEVQRAAMADVRSGKPRQDVFETYRAQVNPEKHLAFSIASVADGDRMKQGEKLNNLLFGMLIFAAVSKALIAMPYFQVSFFRGLFMLALGLLIPVAFAMAVRKYDGQVYPFIIMLAGLGALVALLKIREAGSWMLLEAVLLGVIAALAFRVQRVVFPNINGFSVRKGAQGNYVW